jgi:hypothetical protein
VSQTLDSGEELNPYRWIILVGLITAAILELLDSTIVNVALPTSNKHPVVNFRVLKNRDRRWSSSCDRPSRELRLLPLLTFIEPSTRGGHLDLALRAESFLPGGHFG